MNEVVVRIPGATDSTKYRPLIGGIKISPSSASVFGTLGCLAKRDSDNKIILLSNWHVLVDNPDAIDNDRVGQPNHNGCCSCCATGEIGLTVDGRFKTDNMDAAIALLHGQESDVFPEDRYLNEILDIGIIAGSALPLSGETVTKRGAKTGYTIGQITSDSVIGSTVYKNYNNLSISRDQWEITPTSGPDFFFKR